MQNSRTIILHYHLFKNAGTSIDAILKENFDNKWVTREFNSSTSNTNDVIEWIHNEPEAIAFSSHTMVGEVPKIDGIKIITLMMLRNPVKRIISAYKFERMQVSDTLGARLAKQLSFEDYVVARLQTKGDMQCRNFQTERLSTIRTGDESKIKRAISALDDLSVIGVVEEFETSLQLISEAIKEYYPLFKHETAHSNQSKLFNFEMSPALNQLLTECNRHDLLLWRTAKQNLSPNQNIKSH